LLPRASDAGSGVTQSFRKVNGGTPALYTEMFAVTGRGKHTPVLLRIDDARNIEHSERNLLDII